MLNNLQLHVEQEEIKWRNQLKEKETEIEQIKGSTSKMVRIDNLCFINTSRKIIWELCG